MKSPVFTFTLAERPAFNSIEELNAFQKERFIRLAYRAMQGREPDSEGLHHWLRHVGKNISTADFLAELRRPLATGAAYFTPVIGVSILAEPIVMSEPTAKEVFNKIASRLQSTPEALSLAGSRGKVQ
jgi:hypothetical protein